MNFRVTVQLVAQEEVEEIRAHYEGLKSGLGDRFTEALDSTYAVLRRNPYFQIKRGNYRHLMLDKFPYRIAFEVVGKEVVVYQVRYAGRASTERFGP